jgi:hypothetical protein
MRRICLTIAALAVSLALPAAAEGDPRARLERLMGENCATGEPADRLRLALADLGAEAGPILLGYLAGGAPAEVEVRAREDAAADFDRLTDWIARNPDKVASKLAAGRLERSAYVEEAIDRIDLTWRENALRGLALVDAPGERDAIRTAVEADPRLSILGREALRAN